MTKNVYDSMPPHRVSIVQSRAARNIIEFREDLLRDYGLTSPEWFVLGFVASNTSAGGVKVGDIATELDVQSTYVTGTLRKLETKDLIMLKAAPTDGRVRMITVTKKGNAVFEAVEAEFINQTPKLLGRASDTAIRNYLAVLEIISKN